MSRVILLLSCVAIGAQSSPVPNLTQCKEDDSPCLTKNANKIYKITVQGVPELNIEKLDPMHHDEVQEDLTVIKYKLYNTTIEGFKNCDVANMKLDLKESKTSFDVNCPFSDMRGLYKISGHILVMPIEGSGDYRIQCKDYYVQIDSDIKVSQGKNGKKYMSFKNFKVNGELRGGMIADVNNLFNGQKELAANVLKFINENWKPVAKELQGPVFNANVKKLMKNFNKYFKTVPLDQMLQD